MNSNKSSLLVKPKSKQFDIFTWCLGEKDGYKGNKLVVKNTLCLNSTINVKLEILHRKRTSVGVIF
jgi:hypothetical protein